MQDPHVEVIANPPVRAEPSRPRRWPLVLLILIVLIVSAAGAGAGAAAWRNHEAGSLWTDIAHEQQARALAAEERVEELEGALRRTEQLLHRSEQDVALLESRVAVLAGEKAGAEDTAALAAEMAEDLTGVARLATEVGGELRDCITRNVALTNDIIAAHNADTFDAAAINARISAVNAVCTAAQQSHDQLRSRIDALGR